MKSGFWGEDISMAAGMDRGILLDVRKYIVGVTGIGPCVGTTLLASSLALRLGESHGETTFVEGRAFKGDDGKYKSHEEGAYLEGGRASSAYFQLGLEHAFRRKRYLDIPRMAERGISVAGAANYWNNVNWVVSTPEIDGKDHTSKLYGEKRKRFLSESDVLSQISGKYVIVDTPSSFEKLDALVCVIDPMPSKLKANAHEIDSVHRRSGALKSKIPIIWVMNRANEYVNVKSVENFIDARFKVVIDLFDERCVYCAELNEMHPYLFSQKRNVSELCDKMCRAFDNGTEQIIEILSKILYF